MLDKPAPPFFMAGLQATTQLYIGAATRAETWLAAFNAKGKAGAQQIEALLGVLQVETVAFTQAALPHYFDGTEHHHEVDPKARFNLGDLFTYAPAKETGLPLFLQGTDFANTSIVNPMEKVGYEMAGKRRAAAGKGKQMSADATESSCLSLNFSLLPEPPVCGVRLSSCFASGGGYSPAPAFGKLNFDVWLVGQQLHEAAARSKSNAPSHDVMCMVIPSILAACTRLIGSNSALSLWGLWSA